jgi:hypothetical protein
MQNRELERRESDKADPSPHNSRISLAPLELARGDWKKVIQPRPL